MTRESGKADYPFYRGSPSDLTGLRWLVPLAAVAAATWILLEQLSIFTAGYWRFLPSLLLMLLPLTGLALVAGRHWTALFRKVHLKDVGWMFAFALLNYVIGIALGLIVISLMDTQLNAGVHGLAQSGNADRALFFANSIPQLIGEELITIVPFLALLYFLVRRLAFSTRNAVIVAWLATAVWFAGIHLPTYNWNILQCLILIGGARLVLTLAYIKTRNLWVSAGAHIINDWTTFGLAIVGASWGAAT